MLENRKIFTATIGYIIGIIMGLYCKISIVLFYFAFYFLYLISSKKQKHQFKLISFRRYFRYIKIIFNKKVIKIIIIFSIISNSIVLYQNYKYENLYNDLDEKNIEITGIVLSGSKDKYKLKVTTDSYKNTNLYVYLKSNVKTEIEYGDCIKIKGEFFLPQKRTNYKGFDYNNYLKTIKIYGTIKAGNIKIISKGNVNSVTRYIYYLHNKIKERINGCFLGNEKKAIVEGIILGDKENISENTIEDFSNSNILHILAISGLHIYYIIAISNYILYKLVGKHNGKIFTSIIILLYMCITNFSPSVARAGITGIIMTMSNFFYKKNDVAQNIGTSLLVILIYNPYLLTNAGLQLSFLGTIGIIWINPILKRKLYLYLAIEERKIIRKNLRWKRLMINVINTKTMTKIIEAVITVISVHTMILPIILINFYKISITGVFISAIISFIIGPIIILSIVFIISKISFIGKLLDFVLSILIYITKLGSKIPWSQVYLVTPGIFEILIYYFVVLVLYLYLKIQSEKNPIHVERRIKDLVSLAKYKIIFKKNKFISIAIIIVLSVSFLSIIPKNLRINFVDVGQGDCSLIITPRHKNILIDGGGSENSNYNVRKKSFNPILTS